MSDKHEYMVDLETMGTGPTSAILAIGVVKFSDADGIEDEFLVNVDLVSCITNGLTIDQATVKWWANQTQSAKTALLSQPRKELLYALEELQNFMSQGDWGNNIVWGNGADFDNAILSHAFNLMIGGTPWNFWNNRCYRTMKNLYPNIKMQRTGTHHSALDDARSQAEHLLAIRKHHDAIKIAKIVKAAQEHQKPTAIDK